MKRERDEYPPEEQRRSSGARVRLSNVAPWYVAVCSPLCEPRPKILQLNDAVERRTGAPCSTGYITQPEDAFPLGIAHTAGITHNHHNSLVCICASMFLTAAFFLCPFPSPNLQRSGYSLITATPSPVFLCGTLVLQSNQPLCKAVRITQRSHLRFRRESTISVTLVSAGPTAARRRQLAYVGNVGF